MERGDSGIGVNTGEDQLSRTGLRQTAGAGDRTGNCQHIRVGDIECPTRIERGDAAIRIKRKTRRRLQGAAIEGELVGHRRAGRRAKVGVLRNTEHPGVDRGDPGVGIDPGQRQRARA